MIGPTGLFRARLTPVGWGGLIPQEAHRLADQACNAALILGPAIEQLQAAMAKCTKLEEMAALANLFFVAGMKAIPPAHQRVNQALTDWLASAPRPTPDKLSRHLNMSARQVERIANRYWGAPPRTLARIDRALRAATSIWAGDTDAIEAFSDASHMIREIKRVTGHTPRQLQSLRLNPYHRLYPPKVRDCNSD
jgi:AraC-like DNA-binding protein